MWTRFSALRSQGVRRRSSVVRRGAAGGCLLVALLTAGSCETVRIMGPPPAASSASIDELQVEVMTFADTYVAVVAQAIDETAQSQPAAVRRELHEMKLRCVENALAIAAGRNPTGALLDLTVVVTLQRAVVEEYWIPERLSDPGERMLAAFRFLEDEIWRITDRQLDDEQLAALRALIPEIRARYRDEIFVSSIRASDFAEERSVAGARLEGGRSLLSLFRLDPLAGLTPTAQQLLQTRLLAERSFFWAKRLPMILSWRAQTVVKESLAEPDVQRLLDATDQVTASSERISTTAESLLTQFPEERAAAISQVEAMVAREREAALDQLAVIVTNEREAAIQQAFDGVAAEREALLEVFEQEDERLRGLLGDLRETVDAGTSLATTLNATIASTEQLRASLARSDQAATPGDGDAASFDIAAYQATLDSTTATVEQLNRLVDSLTELMASPAWTDRSTDLTAAADRAQMSMEALIDRSFERGLILIVVLLGGGLLVALVYRFVATRMLTPAA